VIKQDNRPQTDITMGHCQAAGKEQGLYGLMSNSAEEKSPNSQQWRQVVCSITNTET